MAILVTVSRDGVEEAHVFKHSPVRFGRNRLNDLCLPERQVSQWHGLIKFNRHSITYVDLGSTNGTRVHGRGKIKDSSTEISPDDEIRIAKVSIRIRHATPNEIKACEDEYTELCGPPTTNSDGEPVSATSRVIPAKDS